MLLDGFIVPQRGAGEEDEKTPCFFSGVQFKYLIGVVLSISSEGSSFGELFQGYSLD